jgi:hypothetical protein
MTTELGLRHSILHLIMEEGTATFVQMCEFTGSPTSSVRNALSATLRKVLVRRVDNPRTNPAHYGLTPQGIEEAIRLSGEIANEARAVNESKPADAADKRTPTAAADRGLESAWAPAARALGWQQIADEPAQHFTVSQQDQETGPQGELDRNAAQASGTPIVLTAQDPVCAMNSKGEFAIDLGNGRHVSFKAADALVVKRFLDNTSVLEDLAGKEHP